MRLKRRFIAFALAIVMLLDASMVTFATTRNNEITLINTYVECLDTGSISNIETLLCDEEKEEFLQFITNSENKEKHIGYFNYKSAEVVSITECPELLSTLNYEISSYADIVSMSAWECIFDVEVYRETNYLITGKNKFIIVLGYYNDGTPVIIGNVRDRVWSETNVNDENESSNIELFGYDTPVSAPSTGVWTMPSSIVVKSYGNVNFKTYCQKVLAQEYGSNSYNENARKAIALAVKDYGWNRTLVQKYPNQEYDVDYGENDQVYSPNATPSSAVIAAIDSIWNYVALSCDYKLFCTFYVRSRGNSNIESHAIKNGGVISQLEAGTLGDSGYTWQQILHYYYDYGTYNSEMTSGVIKIINLSHSQTGSYSKNGNYHWIVCTTCGCTHSKQSHTWILSGAQYRCTVCGYSTTIKPEIMSLD